MYHITNTDNPIDFPKRGNEYRPDAWILVRFSSKDTDDTYKVLGGWYGGFAGADSWRLCSGIERIVLIDDVYEVHNYSGSVYYCHKDTERFTGLMSAQFNGWGQLAIDNPDKGISIEAIDMVNYYKGIK